MAAPKYATQEEVDILANELNKGFKDLSSDIQRGFKQIAIHMETIELDIEKKNKQTKRIICIRKLNLLFIRSITQELQMVKLVLRLKGAAYNG